MNIIKLKSSNCLETNLNLGNFYIKKINKEQK